MAFKSNLLNSIAASTSTDSSSTDSSSVMSASLESTPSFMLVNPNTEPMIEIDADLRKITVPQELVNIAVEGDHLSETVYIKAPRYFDGIDLSVHSALVRFVNAGNEYGEYKVTDIESDEDSIILGWAINKYATRYRGKIYFTVQFDTVTSDGIQYQWQTTPAELNILAGLNIEKTITEKDDILFRTLTNQIQELQEAVGALQQQVGTYDDIVARLEQLESDVKYLQDNVVYTLDE